MKILLIFNDVILIVWEHVELNIVEDLNEQELVKIKSKHLEHEHVLVPEYDHDHDTDLDWDCVEVADRD
jgi:pyridoxine 5'-phosphate synthase PdxJ